jgi:hypothetical protein
LRKVFKLSLEGLSPHIIFGIREKGKKKKREIEETRGIGNPGYINNNVMQHREIITRNLERVEGNISKLESLLSRGGDVREFRTILEQTRDVVQDVKDYIQREPRTAGDK